MNKYFVIIGKRPKRGVSKTRLAADVGEQRAYDLYEAMLIDFFTRYKKHCSRLPLHFWASPNDEETKTYFESLFERIGLTEYQFFFQPELTFFERLSSIFESYSAEDYLYLTGTDIPDFPFGELEKIDSQRDINIGPDADGGFYFLASKAMHSNIFKIKVSKQSDVFKELMNNIKNAQLSYLTLREWKDIDRMEDLKGKDLSQCPKLSKLLLLK